MTKVELSISMQKRKEIMNKMSFLLNNYPHKYLIRKCQIEFWKQSIGEMIQTTRLSLFEKLGKSTTCIYTVVLMNDNKIKWKWLKK